MSVLTSSSAYRAMQLGIQVNRATATLPATAAQNIFTVTVGRVLLTSLLGEVTTIIQAQSTTVKLTSTPTTGTAVDLTANTGDINALEVGGLITVTPALTLTPFGLAIQKQLAGAATLPAVRIVIPIGSLSYTTGATSTGSIKWTMTYIPLDDGATVVAA